ncbi:MAG: hypothetical protein KDC10_15115 [Calditrichaeota bacterium]|nr:hypothetical protein [Calditrichota bacterium]
MATLWKKGRGRLGLFQPLLGHWIARADSPMGPLRCLRRLEPVLGGKYLQHTVRWEFGPGGSAKVYEEHALIGVGDSGQPEFWSFTSDGKHSHGHLADASDLHPEAIGFEARMPAGLARMVFWPEAEGGFSWVVESRTSKGWNRFVEHRYLPLADA